MLGVQTIGNATLVAYDNVPILATDPWFGNEDEAYFGSWRLSHVIPDDVKTDILASKYIWFSHGHPDHLNPHSKNNFHNNKILLPDHVGGRIQRDMIAQGFDVTVLKDREWVQLSKHVKVLCLTDYLQDAVLLVDVNGRLFINMNDSTAAGNLGFIRRTVKRYKESYLLKLSGYGDTDMINFFDESNNRIERRPDWNVGRALSAHAKTIGAKKAIPFSSFHEFQRSDSIWARKLTTPMEAYHRGFDTKNVDYVAPFVFVDCVSGDMSHLQPMATADEILEPENFGDNWSDQLEKADRDLLTQYFVAKERLHKGFGFLRFIVGGVDHVVKLNGPKHKGITFECPRGSLMTAVGYEIFDDLLIGNFMKTTLHGVRSLQDPDFKFAVARYADQAGAQTEEQVNLYMAEYKRRSGLEIVQYLMERKAVNMVRRYVTKGTPGWDMAKRVYFSAKRAR